MIRDKLWDIDKTFTSNVVRTGVVMGIMGGPFKLVAGCGLKSSSNVVVVDPS